MSTAAATFSSPLIYVECDIPEGMTLRSWRASHTAATVTPMSGVLRRVRRARRARRRHAS